MSITDELREWAHGFNGPWKRNEEMLLAIADRIDAEHESKAGCTADEWDHWESTHIELPKDADGEYIHIGDVMRFGGVKRYLTVLGIGIYGERDHDMGVFVREGDDYVWYNARFLRHYHAPTVEDVLREFAQEFIDYATCIDDHEVTDAIELYAAKLQLREDS